MALLHGRGPMRSLVLLLAACAGGDPDDSGLTDDAIVPLADAGEDRVAEVGEVVRLVAVEASGGEVRWILEDGSALDGASVEHAWDAPGRHVVWLEVEGGDGLVARDALTVLVHWPLVEPAPRSSATLIGGPDGVLVAVMPDFDRLAVVDAASGTLLGHLDTCGDPRRLGVGPDGFAVACTDDAVDVFAWGSPLPTHVVRHELPWGDRPSAVVFDDEGDPVVALEGRGAVVALRESGEELLAVVPDVRGLAWAGGTWLATRFRSPDHGGVWRWGALEGDRVLPLDPGPDSDTGARGVPTYLQAIAVRPDGRVAVFPGTQANVERGLVRDGLPLTFETTVRATLRQASLHADEGVAGEAVARVGFDNRGLASAATFSPLGDRIYVAMSGMGTVEILDAFTLQAVGVLQGVGTAPDGLWASPDGETLWVLAPLSRELTAWSVASANPIEPDLRLDLRPDGQEALPADVLRGKQLFHTSSDRRMSLDGYVSCASCHLDGDSDGRTWDFTDRGEGLRNTIALRGHAGEAPLHWSANFDEVQDFENDIRGPQQGQGFLLDSDWAVTSDTLGASKAGLSADLDAIAAYVESLDRFPRSPWRTPEGELTEQALVGEAVFEDPAVGCVTCHPAPSFTDSAWLSPGVPNLHDVGTLTADSGGRLGGLLPGLDTPTLRGLSATAPYLHDGSAATIREVLVDRNPEDRHGHTSQLDDAALEALAVYLLSLE